MNVTENEKLRTEGAAPGVALRAARAAQNLSVADVARQLKLSVSQVEALEAGAFDRLPGPVFVRGFIRNYARLLKVDPDGILRLVESSLAAPQAHDEKPPAPDIPYPTAVVRRWPKYVLAALLVTAGLVAYEFYWSEPPSVPAARPVADPGAVVPLPAVPAQEVAPAAGTAAAPPAAQEAGPADKPMQPASDAGKPSPAASSQADAQPQPGEAEVRLVFDDDSWVQIRDRSGKAIFSRLNPGGTEQRVSGNPPFTLVVGNARGVRLTYNERPVDLERYIKVDVARFTIE